MRVTTHFGRTTKSGKAFSAKHNDRNYAAELTPPNVDATKSEQNYYSIWPMANEPKNITTFEEHEKWVYENIFGEFFESQNERSRKARHPERVKTIDQFRKMARYCPEEVLWYVGKKGETATPEQLEKMLYEQIKWETETYPNLHYLDWAIHVDEAGAPHVQARRVWTYDKNGVIAVGQNKSLEQMDVPLPNPNQPVTADNNRKVTYTAAARAHWIALAEKMGYEIEKTPREKNGLTLAEWQSEQDIERREKTLSDAENDLLERSQEQNRQITSTNEQIADFNSALSKYNHNQTYELNAMNALDEMIEKRSLTEKTPSHKLFDLLKFAVRKFFAMRERVMLVFKKPLNQVIAKCIEAQELGCSTLEEYYFPENHPVKTIEPIQTQNKAPKKEQESGRSR